MKKKLAPVTEQFQHFVQQMQESFWGDVYDKVKQAVKELLEADSERTSEAVLVSSALRLRHARAHPQHADRQSLVTIAWAQDQSGSVDVYFAPKAPAGKESNWVPTDPKGRFEALFRFYGPEKPLFEKTWVLPDIEKIS